LANKCPICHSDNPDTLKFCGECGTQLPPPQGHSPVMTETLQTPVHELTTGSTFAGRFQVIEELGHGGMGRVYKVHDTKVGEKIALKLIRPEAGLDKTTIERFSNELRLARKIRHKNICQMFDLGEDKGTRYITMEYVHGEDLKQLVRKVGRLSPGQAVGIAKQVCEGLEEAHKLGVVHRDLKPQNIMIDEDGNARIMDFGIARSLSGKGITGAGVMIGTPEYMSPEQVEGKEVDARSDIYSLGIILYEMVTGRVPFEGDTPFTIGVKQKSEIPRPPKELNDQVPEDLNSVILKCLAKDRGGRYQSAADLFSELGRIHEGIPTTARLIPKKKALTSKTITVSIGVKKLIAPAAVLIALLAVVLWLVIPKKKGSPVPTDKPSVAVMYFKNNTGDAGLDHWRTMLANLLVTDLTQSKYLRVLSEEKLFQILDRLDQENSQTYSADVLRQVAVEGGVNHILQGAYARAGDEFRINVTLQDAASGELIGSESAAGKGEAGIFSMVDELTRKIKGNFKLSLQDIASDIDKDVGIVTTKSPEAYKYYVEGIRHDLKGEYRQEIASMEKAVVLDPEFASAYLAMSWSYSNQALFAEEDKYLGKAMSLSDRLPEREKYNIQGLFFAKSEKTYGQAVEALEKLLALYPDDIQGGNVLAIVYGRMGKMEEAIERYKACIQTGTEDVVVYENLAGAYKIVGAFDKSVEVQESYLKNIRDSAVMRRSLADTYLLLGKPGRALAELDKAVVLSPSDWENFRSRGDIYVYTDNLRGAKEEYEKLGRENVAGSGRGWRLVRLAALCRIQGRFGEAQKTTLAFLEYAEKFGQDRWVRNWRIESARLELLSGRPEAALRELKKAWTDAVRNEDFQVQRDALLCQGLACLGMKELSKAQDVVAKLKASVDQAPDKKHAWYFHFLDGMIELEKKNHSKAIASFNLGRPLLDADSIAHLLFADALGAAYYRTGDLENARREYAKIISMGLGRLDYGEKYVLSHYWLGMISERQAKNVEAAEHYRKFLDLWKDADPGLPEVEDARKRLAGLKVN
jgi:serine/threonine protein kinase/Flp pilus assembly protein TadD